MILTEHAYAKLNLSLDILGKRPDGYHDLCMVMQSIDLHDTLTLTERPKGELEVCTTLSYLPRDESNIAVKALRRFTEATGLTLPGFSLAIEKRIPVCAGMAGGSSDGAAVLRVLGRAYAPAAGCMPGEDWLRSWQRRTLLCPGRDSPGGGPGREADGSGGAASLLLCGMQASSLRLHAGTLRSGPPAAAALPPGHCGHCPGPGGGGSGGRGPAALQRL